jgi:hypothetical protein
LARQSILPSDLEDQILEMLPASKTATGKTGEEQYVIKQEHSYARMIIIKVIDVWSRHNIADT